MIVNMLLKNKIGITQTKIAYVATTTNEKPYPWSLYNGAAIQADANAFGGSSLRLDGTNDYAAADPGDAAFNLVNAAAWTVEGWVALDNPNAVQGLFYNGATNDNNNRIQLGTNGTTGRLTLYLQAGTGTGISYISTTALQAALRHHVAICKNNDDVYLFIDGQLEASGTYTSPISVNRLIAYIGLFRTGGALQYAAGNFDDWRITNGVARYAANFAPPIAPYPNS